MTILSKRKQPPKRSSRRKLRNVPAPSPSEPEMTQSCDDNHSDDSSFTTTSKKASKQVKRRLKADYQKLPRRKCICQEKREPPSATRSEASKLPTAEYNSEDEYVNPTKSTKPVLELQEEDRLLEQEIAAKGFIVKKMREDGACLFRSIADQIFGDEEKHAIVRKECLDYIWSKRDFYQQFISENIESYVERKRRDSTYGNHLEIQAIVEVYGRPVQIFLPRHEPMLVQGNNVTDSEPLRISYHRRCHYNSVVVPSSCCSDNPEALASPETTEKSISNAEDVILQDALRQSEASDIEKAIMDNQLKDTDREETFKVMEDEVARKSLREFIEEQAFAESENDLNGRLSPSLYEFYGGSSVLASVFALSTQEYFDSFKKADDEAS